jgi:ATP-dependent protease HslVU (ClpYQ) peptidase subunit
MNMSIVAVKIDKEKITIGADSIQVHGTTQNKDSFAKLIQINGMIIGQSGYAKDFSLLSLFAKTHKPNDATNLDIIEFFSEYLDWAKKKIGNDYRIESSFLLVYEKRAFRISSDFFVKEVKEFDAIGAGRDFALAALHLGLSVQEAIKVACELSIFCEEPVNIIEEQLTDRREYEL